MLIVLCKFSAVDDPSGFSLLLLVERHLVVVYSVFGTHM